MAVLHGDPGKGRLHTLLFPDRYKFPVTGTPGVVSI